MTSTACKNIFGATEWRNKVGHLHCENGPAIEWAEGTREWFFNDLLHREDGPAVEYSNGRKEWWVNGQQHHEDGPAVEGEDGTVHFWLHGNTGPEIEQ